MQLTRLKSVNKSLKLVKQVSIFYPFQPPSLLWLVENITDAKLTNQRTAPVKVQGHAPGIKNAGSIGRKK